MPKKSKPVSHTNQSEVPQSRSLRSLVIALFLIFILFLAFFLKYILTVLALLVAIISILGIFSPKTPIGQVFKSCLLSDRDVSDFFEAYKNVLKYLSTFAVIISLYAVLVIVDFMAVHSFIIRGSIFYVYSSLLLLVFIRPRKEKQEIEQTIFAMATKIYRMSLAVILLLIFFTVGGGISLATLINTGRFDNTFNYVKNKAYIVDDVMKEASNMQEYAHLIEIVSVYRSAGNLFIRQLGYSKEDYDLWSPINWSSTEAYYVVDDSTLLNLRLSGVPESYIDAIIPIVGKRFKGNNDFIQAIYELTGGEASQYEVFFLHYSIKSDQKQLENRFKLASVEFENAFENEKVKNRAKMQLNTALNKVKWRHPIFPLKVQPSYITDYILAKSSREFANLAAAMQILTIRVIIFLVENYSSIRIMSLTLLSVLGCYLLSKKVKVYNERYDPDYPKSNPIFFILITLVSLFIAIMTIIL